MREVINGMRPGLYNIILSIICFVTVSYSQSISPYFTQTQHNSFLEYAINSGFLSPTHIFHQPFQTAELYHAIESGNVPDHVKHWIHILKSDLLRFYQPDSVDDKNGRWNLGLNGSYHLISDHNRQRTRYRAEVFGIYTLPYLVLANRTVTDQTFKDDPLYYGDTGEWIYGRVEDAYAIFNYKALSIFGGRISRNLGSINETSLVLSDNPYSYDHFGIQVSTRRFRYVFYTTRLNDMMAFDSEAEDQTPQLSKRYFAIQRADLSMLQNLKVGISEIVVYGGPGQNFEAFYLNPLNFYYVAQRNQLKEMNGLWAAEFFWKPGKHFSWFVQFLLDDIIINNEAGQNDRSNHPDRMGLCAKVSVTDIVIPGTQLSLRYNRVGNWTYTSYRTWENYVYHEKGMGYSENSSEDFSLQLNYFGQPPFQIQMSGGFTRLGDQKLTAVFGDTKNEFPVGIVEKISWVDFEINYIPSHLYYIGLNVNYRKSINQYHVIGNDYSGVSVTMSLNASWNKNFVF